MNNNITGTIAWTGGEYKVPKTYECLGDVPREIDNDFDLDSMRPDAEGVFKIIECPCGNRTFEILYTGQYETSAHCLKCGEYFIVHSG
jgi:hypothetical protein